MEFQILGPVSAERDGQPVPLDGAKQRATLAALLLARGRLVTDERLTTLLWGWDPPTTSTRQLYTYVSRLRTRLGPGHGLTRHGSGYRMDPQDAVLDWQTFHDLADAGRADLRAGRFADAERRLAEALALWHGPALGDVTEELARAEGPRMEEARLTALEDHTEAALALGRHHDLVPALTGHVHHHPLRERLRGQLMTALYRCGRQADALALYDDARRLLADDLGIDPSPALRTLHHQILTATLPPAPTNPLTPGQPMAAAQPLAAAQLSPTAHPFTTGQPSGPGQPLATGRPFETGRPSMDARIPEAPQPFETAQPPTTFQLPEGGHAPAVGEVTGRQFPAIGDISMAGEFARGGEVPTAGQFPGVAEASAADRQIPVAGPDPGADQVPAARRGAAGGALVRAEVEGAGRPVVPAQGVGGAGVSALLPCAPADFTGREAEIDEVAGALRARHDVVITGAPGSGTSVLALRVAEACLEDFPDGRLYADLRTDDGGRRDAHETLGWFLRALGIDTDRLPGTADERARLFRAQVAERRVLIVLDNAADDTQVRPLLPGGTTSRTLVTGTHAALASLEAVRLVRLGPMTPAEAAELLASQAGTARLAAEPEATLRVAEFCDRLPLALRIAGARLAARPHWPVARLADRLAPEEHRLDELRIGALDIATGLRTALAALPAPVAEALGVLAAAGLPRLTARDAAALLDLTPRDAEDVLDQLTDAHLATARYSDEPCYRLPPLVRLYALRQRSYAAAYERELSLT
ncbi:BTAD domain-containing putative transcriptional regulator [Streptomyces sp. NPDC052013]|uniref:AfsR/SARP family transcriptional regulator n=1 Tax=Streptomyces sp. NPDC052013 TaxID=3365679 RepID=UPI0037CD07F9